MAKESGIYVVDAASGELYERRPKKKSKRTEPFYMTYQKDSIELAKMKLTAMEHRILRYLEGIMDYDNVAAVTQAFLAKELDTTEATVSVSLKGLERAGLIERPKQHGVKVFKVAKHVAQRGKDKDPAK